MTKKLLLIGVVIGLLVLGSINILNQYSYADRKKCTEEYINLAGEFIKNNPELLAKSLNAVENKPVNYEDVVTNIDLLPISIGEIEFRKGLTRITGFKELDNKTIFNTLVEEKIIISYAIKNNVFPTKVKHVIKNKILLEVNKQYFDRGFVLDKSKLYL